METLKPTKEAREDSMVFFTRVYHDAQCSVCGQRCKVPFNPAPNRPVYCHLHLIPKKKVR